MGKLLFITVKAGSWWAMGVVSKTTAQLRNRHFALVMLSFTLDEVIERRLPECNNGYVLIEVVTLICSVIYLDVSEIDS